MYTAATTTHRPVRSRGALSGLRGALDCWRSRRALGRLDAERLADLGIDRASARAEAARPPWDVPATWLR